MDPHDNQIWEQKGDYTTPWYGIGNFRYYKSAICGAHYKRPHPGFKAQCFLPGYTSNVIAPQHSPPSCARSSGFERSAKSRLFTEPPPLPTRMCEFAMKHDGCNWDDDLEHAGGKGGPWRHFSRLTGVRGDNYMFIEGCVKILDKQGSSETCGTRRCRQSHPPSTTYMYAPVTMARSYRGMNRCKPLWPQEDHKVCGGCHYDW